MGDTIDRATARVAETFLTTAEMRADAPAIVTADPKNRGRSSDQITVNDIAWLSSRNSISAAPKTVRTHSVSLHRCAPAKNSMYAITARSSRPTRAGSAS